jgi:predicted transcriptional regulator
MREIEPLIISSPRRIREVREKVGWNQKRLAKEVGLKSVATISKIEREEYLPSYSTLEKIFTVLNKALIGLMDPTKVVAGSIMNQPITSISSSERVRDAMTLMAKDGYSQLPVIDGDVNKGSVTENIILAYALEQDELIRNIPEAKHRLPIVSEFTPLTELRELLLREPAVLVGTRANIQGIITKHDIFAKVKL